MVHPGPLNFLDANLKTMSLPALPFTIAMPALSLLLVFRTNTVRSRSESPSNRRIGSSSSNSSSGADEFALSAGPAHALDPLARGSCNWGLHEGGTLTVRPVGLLALERRARSGMSPHISPYLPYLDALEADEAPVFQLAREPAVRIVLVSRVSTRCSSHTARGRPPPP